MYQGRYQQGQYVCLPVLCTNGSGVPTVPDSAPHLRILSSSGLVQAVDVPVQDRYGTTGLFLYPLFLGALYPAGLYQAEFTWNTGNGAFHGLDVSQFEVVAGGSPDGPILSLAWYHRPQADWVLQQTHSGRILQGRNPRV